MSLFCLNSHVALHDSSGPRPQSPARCHLPLPIPRPPSWSSCSSDLPAGLLSGGGTCPLSPVLFARGWGLFRRRLPAGPGAPVPLRVFLCATVWPYFVSAPPGSWLPDDRDRFSLLLIPHSFPPCLEFRRGGEGDDDDGCDLTGNKMLSPLGSVSSLNLPWLLNSSSHFFLKNLSCHSRVPGCLHLLIYGMCHFYILNTIQKQDCEMSFIFELIHVPALENSELWCWFLFFSPLWTILSLSLPSIPWDLSLERWGEPLH